MADRLPLKQRLQESKDIAVNKVRLYALLIGKLKSDLTATETVILDQLSLDPDVRSRVRTVLIRSI